ncbi:alpha/beta fold hydrolase [Extensimonas vulgaris]|uniref:Pimeloyl-ACP methyl ester carboxylesterase n=1 Tax=Extensimonas vulgaris TaxID=1031594 RepID=A0A369AJ40_9BURK|nr:alpha/beta hydrolase [Extensimonas vulgaris]RCX09419.1 pimeloyl-ACP methyl ester carboxylesterase [Extensimonas vulgaris]TWI38550.1 pimeloyl-ACP methyl ester carboxylesterase [Extensimonas vulgaris]TXD13526.1 alpha/beta hydrolase [Extensimonas vulgaris]
MSGRREFSGFAGGPLVADVYGPEGAPAVLLLHGGGQTRHAWGNAAQALGAAGWYTVALDLPGHGESAWARDGDYRIETLARTMCSVWRQIGAPLAVVGASLGGLASMAAVGLPDAPPINALVLVDIAPRMEEAGVERIVSFMRAKPEGFASLEEAAQHIAAYRGKPMTGPLEGLKKNLRLNAQGRWIWHWDPLMMSEANHNHRRDAENYERALRGLQSPTLLIRGQRSDVITKEDAEALVKTLPNARFVDLRDAGHMIAGDANDAFTASVREFLSEVMPPSPASAAAVAAT